MSNLNTKTITFPVNPIMDTWKTLQLGHEAVVRWKGPDPKNPGYVDCNKNLPIQTNLHHQVSVERLFHYFLGHTDGHFSVDRELVMDAIKVHEDGEAILRRDVLLHNKIPSGHVDEYMAFNKMLVGGPNYVVRMRRAFLLQFVLDEGFEVPGDSNANILLEKLRKNNQNEATLFNLLERFDYYLYAVRAYKELGDVVILAHILRNNWLFLDSYSRLIPGVASLLWTGELNKTAIEFMNRYKDIPGPKDEGGIPAAYAYAVEKGYMTI